MSVFDVLNPTIQSFIDERINQSVSNLALQKNPFPSIDYKIILNQIVAKSKSKDKLPTWFHTKNIVYPFKISIEQTSSELTAKIKSNTIHGKSIIDLTGGFGVDCYYFSNHFEKVIHCELNETLSQIVQHNFKILNKENIECFCGDSQEILKKLNSKFDYIYIDPSRRNDIKGKVFMLKDCLPNVPLKLDLYFQYSDKILIKTSPLLDLTSGLSELNNVKSITIVALKNEVKELLWEIEKEHSGSILIKTINSDKVKNEEFQFVLNSDSIATFGLPKKYLYEPNSAVLKSGGFSEVSSSFELEKLHQHSHLYTSDTLIDFPGRVFEIQKCISYSKNEIKQNLSNIKSNITIRNFPETVDNIRKKWKINDGGNLYSFFTTDMNNNKIVLICNKL